MKLFLPGFAIIMAPLFCAAQNDMGELKGVVTFKAANGRNHPDAGAEVIIYRIDSVKTPGGKYDQHHAEDSLVNNSFLATMYYDEYLHSPIGKTQKQMVKKLKAMDAYPENKLNELDNVAFAIIRNRELKQYARATADGRGGYSVKLQPGYYCIIYRSRHLRSHSKAQMAGNVMLDEAVIAPRTTLVKNEELL